MISVYVRRSRLASCCRSKFRNTNIGGETSTGVDVKYSSTNSKPEVINVKLKYDKRTTARSAHRITGHGAASSGYISYTSSSRGYCSSGSYSGACDGSSGFSGGSSGGGGGGGCGGF